MHAEGVPAPGTVSTGTRAGATGAPVGAPPRPTSRPRVDAEPRGTRLRHQPALDGLRGLAVLAVVLYHGAAADRLGWLEDWTRGGFLGVSAFFTLSGFLICSLLVVEHDRFGGISLRRFWSRRFRRLLPASLVLLAAVVLLTPTLGTESQLRGLPGDVWASLLDVANWRFILQGTDYADQFSGAPSPLEHLWSLSIEEQWYLLVPLVAAALLHRRHRGRRGTDPTSGRPRSRRSHRGRLAAFWVAAIAASLGMQWWLGGGEYANRVYMGTGTRLAEMAVGALLAVVLAGRFELPRRARRLVVSVAPLVLVGLLVIWARTPLEADWLYRGGLALHAVAVAVVILAAVQPGGPVRRVLSWRPLVGLGMISYAVYLFHWPLLWWITPTRLGLPGTTTLVIQVALTVALAVLSYRYLEKPIRGGYRIMAWRRAAVPLGAMAAIAVGAALLPAPDPSQVLALGDHPRLAVATTTTAAPRPEPSAVPGAPSTTATTTTAPPPPLKVMVVGDSFAESVAMGLQQWGTMTGRMTVLDASITGCSFGRGGRNKGVGFNRAPTAECRARDRTLLQDLGFLQPDVVLVAGGMWDVTDRRPEGFPRWTRIGDPAYDNFLRAEIDHLARLAASSGALVLWANAPRWDPVPDSVIFMGDPPYSEAEPGRVERYNQVLAEAIAARPEARLFDLAGWMQAWPGGELAPDLRPDGVHFSEASTVTVAEWLGPELIRIARPPEK